MCIGQNKVGKREKSGWKSWVLINKQVYQSWLDAKQIDQIVMAFVNIRLNKGSKPRTAVPFRKPSAKCLTFRGKQRLGGEKMEEKMEKCTASTDTAQVYETKEPFLSYVISFTTFSHQKLQFVNYFKGMRCNTHRHTETIITLQSS